jgi:molybdopterin/thiamine biosynthesis adenylyltransferase
MSDDGLMRITQGELEEDRFSRFRLIQWWDQSQIKRTRVLVVGAGALGNEIIKNLALLGFSNVLIVDMDRVQQPNLSRSVLFRPSDVGQGKAETAARSAREIYPEMTAWPLKANVIFGVGLGAFAWSDVVIGGLDNREARLWINRSAWKMNRPWIDGAIEGINGVARVFLPGKPPCYECTLGEVDWSILEKRMSCNLLTREEMVSGKTATTPTTASVVAGIQVQELLKLVHGLPTLDGEGFVFEGLNHTSYKVKYTENEDCLSHETFERMVFLPQTSTELTLEEVHRRAQADLGCSNVDVQFSRDIIHKLVCRKCGKEEEFFAPVGTISYSQGACPQDGEVREVVALHNYRGVEPFGRRPLKELGLPPFDVLCARGGDREVQYLVAGDAAAVLGPLSASFGDPGSGGNRSA